MSSICGGGQLTLAVPGHLGRSPSTVVGRLIYSHVNIRERNSDTFPKSSAFLGLTWGCRNSTQHNYV